MSKETLAIGNTGAQLVSKFNANFVSTKNIYNVETYGAVHDGETDDTSAIQDAINACSTAGGGVVYFPNGTYLIAGDLQNNIGDNSIDYNSQLYIPGTKYTSPLGSIRLIGESFDWYNTLTKGVILRSTIAGSGDWPSVICSMAEHDPYHYMSHRDIFLENIKIVVNAFEDGDGPSMCGINFLFCGNANINNVAVSIDCAIADSVIPVAHVFALGVGFVNDEFPRVGRFICNGGFYYGVVSGEGVLFEDLHIHFCYIGLTSLTNAYASTIIRGIIHWCAYTIASQQETFYTYTASTSYLEIRMVSIEDRNALETPAWCIKEDTILDVGNNLFGKMDYMQRNGSGPYYLTKSNGGVNFRTRNKLFSELYDWTTANRPLHAGLRCIGLNTTSNKVEWWDGSSWVDL